MTHYIRTIKQIPLLTEAEEIDLFTHINNDGCNRSMERVITSNLRFVVHLAYKFKNYKVSVEDLIQEGNIGLMRAIKTFSLAHNVRFVTYAQSWIKSAMLDYIANNSGDVKFPTTKPKRKIYFNRSKLYEDGIIRDINIVAKELNVDVSDIKSYLEYSKGFVFLDDVDNIDIEDKNNNINNLIDIDDSNYHYNKMTAALNQLPERSKDIITSRYLKEDKINLDVLGVKYGISLERVRQIEKNGLKKLKDIMLEI